MRVTITAATVAIASLMVLGFSYAQTRSQSGNYQRCVGLANWEGLDTKSAKGRAFMSRCMKHDPRRNCPDDSKARSAYPAWMCP
jgi:hypothetical protein